MVNREAEDLPVRSIYRTLREATPEEWGESFGWLLYSLAGSTLPIWLGGYVLLPIFGTHFAWIEYGRHGEFALYSAALLAPTLRLIAKDVENFEFVRRQAFLFFGWIFLTGAVAIYSAVIAADRIANGTATLNQYLLLVISLSLYGVSVIFSFLVTIIDCRRVPTNFREIVKAETKKLDAEFEKSGGGSVVEENRKELAGEGREAEAESVDSQNEADKGDHVEN